MERAHRHASELTNISIDIDCDVEAIAAATDHLQVKFQCRPRYRCAESSQLAVKWAHAGERRANDARWLITPTVSSWV